MKTKKIILLGVIASLVGVWTIFDLQAFFTLEYIQQHHEILKGVISEQPLTYSLVFFFGYIFITSLSLPGAAIITLLGAALFGFWWSLLLVSFASTIGATLSFLVSRYLLKDWVQRTFGRKLKAINEGIKKDGTSYLLTLRLLPIFPFFLINLLMGLTTISAARFYLVSQIGMLPGSMIYLNAGTQLAQIESLKDIISPSIFLSLILLGAFPLIFKYLIDKFRCFTLYKAWQKPKQFDRNMIVIGAGAGGLVTSYISAAVNAKVSLIEKHKMGGDCLNTGCVPSKALLRSAKTLSEITRAHEFGIHLEKPKVNFEEVMARVRQVISKIEHHDSIDRYTSLGVECIQGEAKILSPWAVEVNDERLTTKNIVIATGARPFIPDITGLDKVEFLTSDNIWQLKKQPKKLLVLGGGPIGCELSQAFAILGSKVTLIEMQPQVLIREDQDVSELVATNLEKSGVKLLLSHKAIKFDKINGKNTLIVSNENNEESPIEFDQVLLALGRTANVKGFGLEDLGVALTDRGTIKVNKYLQTNYPNIYAVGDVCGPFQLTHAAAHQAWYATVNALFGMFKKFKTNYRVMPAATYTNPEVARVGLNEKEATKLGIAFDVTRYNIDDLDRAITDGEDHGFVKILTPKGKDKILGATIVGYHAGDLLAEFTLAMENGLGLNDILSTIHPYPTFSEATKFAAGFWKRANAPEIMLKWLSKFHTLQRKEKKQSQKDVSLSLKK